MKSVFLPDHPKLSLDSLHETADSPVQGLVHRYPDKALFLGKWFDGSRLDENMSEAYLVRSNIRLSDLLYLLH